MTDTSSTVSEPLWEDEKIGCDLDVEIEASPSGLPMDDIERAVSRIERAVEEEIRTIQDGLDEEGEVVER